MLFEGGELLAELGEGFGLFGELELELLDFPG